LKAANILPKDVQNYITNGSETESDPPGISNGEAYRNFATSIMARHTLIIIIINLTSSAEFFALIITASAKELIWKVI